MDTGSDFQEHHLPDSIDSTPSPAVYRRGLPPEFLDADAVKVLRRLERHGYVAYLVGGGVRDLLLHRRPKDFDVATDARPAEVKRLFRNCRVIGRRFRLAHILFSEGKIIECATFRRDPEQEYEILPLDDASENGNLSSNAVRLMPSRESVGEDEDLLIRHDNHFGAPHEDAIRRDFTINGLFYDMGRGEVIDYVGGMADLEKRVVRTIGEPGVRFREDPVRILRAIKFSARLDMGIDRDVYRAMIDHRAELAKAAKPRVLEELLRLLRGGAAHRSIFLMLDLGVLGEILPALAESLDPRNEASDLVFQRLRMIDELQADGELPSDAVLLAALFAGAYETKIAEGMAPAAAIAEVLDEPSERLVLPRRLRDRISTIVVVQKRLRAGRFASVLRRDFFAEGATLFAIDRMAEGESVPDWALDPPAPDELDEGPPRRRRRRRRHPA
jgi:poly(A) polymerase